MEPALEQILSLLLESERAGVVALEELGERVDKDELREFLRAAIADEKRNILELEKLITAAGGQPSQKVGPFAEKMAALESVRDRFNLLSRGQSWVAMKVEAALDLAPAEGPIHDFLCQMAGHHRHEIEWGRAEVIRLLGAGD